MAETPRPVADLSLEEVTALARRTSMRKVGTRPPFGQYLKDLWDRRHFLWTLSSGRNYARNEGQRFGQLWAVINPLLLIATYLFIFGYLLRTGRGIDNFVAYLSIGVILFGVSAATLTGGSRAILNNTGLVRALQFPRAILPISVVLTEVLALVPGLVVLLVILPFTSEMPHWKWLLLPVPIALLLLQQVGMTLILARVVNASVDTWNLIPVAVRVMRYLSGVFFSVSVVTKGHPVLGVILEYQPFALQLTLARQTLMSEFPIQPTDWLVGLGWALVLPIAGLWIFWRDEARYGRG